MHRRDAKSIERPVIALIAFDCIRTNACFCQLRDIIIYQLPGSGHNTDIRQRSSICLQFFNFPNYKIKFVACILEISNDRSFAMCKRLASVTQIHIFIQIIERYPIQQSKCISPDFFRRSIVDLQNAASTSHIYATLGKRRMIPVNALVRITYDKKIIFMFFSGKCTQ